MLHKQTCEPIPTGILSGEEMRVKARRIEDRGGEDLGREGKDGRGGEDGTVEDRMRTDLCKHLCY